MHRRLELYCSFLVENEKWRGGSDDTVVATLQRFLLYYFKISNILSEATSLQHSTNIIKPVSNKIYFSWYNIGYVKVMRYREMLLCIQQNLGHHQ